MKISHLFASTLAGACFATALIVACSDDSPSDADAAVCDCPAAEPPLAGRITSVVSPTTVQPSTSNGAIASCPQGATLLGGGCRNITGDVNVATIDAGPRRDAPTMPAYTCTWVSTSANPVSVQAEAICLVPAQ